MKALIGDITPKAISKGNSVDITTSVNTITVNDTNTAAVLGSTGNIAISSSEKVSASSWNSAGNDNYRR